MSEDKLKDELQNIRDQYFEYPTKSIRPEEAIARQNVHYLLGVIDALMLKGKQS